ncbi:uncharacterized protein EDB93DRAFT_1190247, partial [Suillus bovinus]|uniref:uncharacterized protein n=1 Tax=Suillus bovinus TaxID=48563 RepID=UPI001B85BF7F
HVLIIHCLLVITYGYPVPTRACVSVVYFLYPNGSESMSASPVRALSASNFLQIYFTDSTNAQALNATLHLVSSVCTPIAWFLHPILNATLGEFKAGFRG